MEKTKSTEQKIDFNEISLFETPVGRIVQMQHLDILLKKPGYSDKHSSYISKVNDALYNLSHSFWDITLIIKLIRFAHPKIKSFKMTRVDRGEFLKYNFENYFFRVPKLKDQVIQLLNVIYQMDYEQNLALEKRVKNHPKIQGNNFYHFIDYFDAVLKDMVNIRHRIAHRGDLQDQRLAMLGAYSLVEIDKELYDLEASMIVAKSNIFEKNQAILKEAVVRVLSMLENDFNLELALISES
ncbi:HEPN [compost metagenome]